MIEKPEEEWLSEMTVMECYAGIDVRSEFTRARRWLVTRPKRRMTQRFFANWLAKCPARPTLPKSPSYEDTF